jgi:N6-L-threonylcarbamoyladenine synthase
MKSPEDYQIIGQTLDDAVGESLDKIGRMLGLPYPGGVAISRIVGLEHGNPLNLPIPMKGDPSFNVSNSGLKTAVRYLVQQQNFDHWSFEDRLSDGDAEILLKYKEKIEKNPHLEFIYQVAVSAHTVVLEQVLNTSRKILKKHQFASIGLSGGVSANPFLRKGMQDLGYPTFLPDRSLTGDNAVMIGLSGLMDNGGW